MTDISHLKKQYSDYRKEMKRGYGVHSIEMVKNDMRDIMAMIDILPVSGSGWLSMDIRKKIKSIVKDDYVVTSRKSVKTIVKYIDNEQLLLVRDVIIGECRKV